MTPRSSCPGGEGTPLRGAVNLWHCQINTLPQPPPRPRILSRPRSTAFCSGTIPRRNRALRLADDPYSLAGSVLGSRGGQLFASAEAANGKNGDAHHLPVVALRTLQWIVPGQLL